ncbi:MAG: DegT/DnrJ/EryC1/StrS family aminotransferase [Acidimicrobiia bacterium]|nr:DegT/DnrJ/EryC1/StrS family aminotransferase [Acidimicrobiia bacterium]
MPVPYARPALPDADLIADDVREIVASRWLTKGPFVGRYEEALSKRLAVPNVVATSSCTVGLAYLYRTLGFQGEVILPSFTFLATATALSWAGGTPVFVDIDPDTLTVDPEAVAAAVTPRTTGIIGVHVFGVAVDPSVDEIAVNAGVPLVFDAAHGVGSSCGGKSLAMRGTASAFSTTPTKTLITGEGGFVTTGDDELAARIRILNEYGNDGSYDTITPGLNGRMPETSAAIGIRSLEMLDDVLEARWTVVDGYRERLSDLEGIRTQTVPEGCRASYKDFTIIVEDAFGTSRDDLASGLSELGIDTRPYFSPAVHRHRAYQDLGFVGSLPVTEDIEHRVLSLPLWVGMGDAEIDEVVAGIASLRG